MTDYLTVDTAGAQAEIELKKSRFIALVGRAENTAQATQFLEKCRRNYPGATHYCYAYVTADGQKYTDAGEPQGTAGLPIYQALQRAGLMNVVAVVVRYFGGVKLGAGVLTRMYGKAVAGALARVSLRRCCPGVLLTITVPYAQVGLAEKIFADGAAVQDKQFADVAQFVVAVPEINLTTLQQQLQKHQFAFRQTASTRWEFPV